MTDKLAIFQGKQIRRVLHKGEWYFSVVDIVAALTDSDNPRDYWYRMKRREKESSNVELSTFCRQLKLTSSDRRGLALQMILSFPRRRESGVRPCRGHLSVNKLSSNG
jgi:prophage antirepressor-like protein